MTIRESDTELLFEFLEENNWEYSKSAEGFPTIDLVSYFYKKNNFQIQIDVEHWRETVLNGESEILNKLQSDFELFKKFNSGDEKILFQNEDSFKGSALVFFLSNIKSIRFLDYVLLIVFNLLFLLPCFLWLSSKSSFSYFESGLLVFVLLVYLFLSMIYIRSIARQIHKKGSHINTINEYPDIIYKSRTNKLIKLDLQKQLFSKVYDQSYNDCYLFSNESLSMIVGNFNLAITRRINNKIGSQNLKDKAFIYLESKLFQKDLRFDSTNEIVDYLKNEISLDLSFLSDYQLNGQTQNNSCVLFFTDEIKLPKAKLFLIKQIQKNIKSCK